MGAPDESVRFGVLSVPAYAIRWFIGLFTLGSIYLTIANTLSVVFRTGASGWLEIQRIATEELVRAGGASLVGSVIIVRVGNVVLGEWIRQRRGQKDLEEGKAIGRKEGLKQGIERGVERGVGQGREEIQALWDAWFERRQAAEKRGESFDEPPPSLNNQNGSTG